MTTFPMSFMYYIILFCCLTENYLNILFKFLLLNTYDGEVGDVARVIVLLKLRLSRVVIDLEEELGNGENGEEKPKVRAGRLSGGPSPYEEFEGKKLVGMLRSLRWPLQVRRYKSCGRSLT